MKKTLQDQLLKAGLASKQKPQQTAKKKQPKAKKKHTIDQTASSAESARNTQAEKDKARNKALHEAAQAKAEFAQIRQIILSNSICVFPTSSLPAQATPYYFIHDQIVKRIYVDTRQRIQLATGQLGLVQLESEEYILTTPEAIEKIRKRQGQQYIVLTFLPDSMKAFYIRHPDETDYIWPQDYQW